MIVVVGRNDELLARCRQEWGGGRANSQVEIVVVGRQFAGRQGSSRNSLLLLARADVVSFLDDDAEAAPDWLERLLPVYETYSGAVAVGGAPWPNYGAPRPCWLPTDFDWVFGCDYRSLPDRLAPVRHLIGTSMTGCREEMLPVGGFHPDDCDDDMDPSHRVAHAHGPSGPSRQVHQIGGFSDPRAVADLAVGVNRRKPHRPSNGKAPQLMEAAPRGTWASPDGYR